MDLDFSAFGGKTPTLNDLLTAAEHTLQTLYKAKYNFNGHLKEDGTILIFSQMILSTRMSRLIAALSDITKSFRVELYINGGLCDPDKWDVEPLRALLYLSKEDTAKKFFEEDIQNYISMPPTIETLLHSGFFSGLSGPYDDY